MNKEGEGGMKNRIIFFIFYIIVAALLIFGPRTIFKVCEQMDDPMKCYWSIRAEIGTAIWFIAIALAYIFTKNRYTRIAHSFYGIVGSIVAILIPAVLIGGCADMMMECRSVAFPAIYIISGLTIVVSLGNIIYLKQINEEK